MTSSGVTLPGTNKPFWFNPRDMERGVRVTIDISVVGRVESVCNSKVSPGKDVT